MKKWLFFLLIAVSISSCSVLSPNSKVYINGDTVETDAVSVPLTKKQSEGEKVKIQNESQTGQNFLYTVISWLGFK